MPLFDFFASLLEQLFIYGVTAYIIFFGISIFVFLVTGKSLLYRIVEWNNRMKEQEAERQVEEELRRQADAAEQIRNLPVPENESHLDYFDRKNRRAVNGLPARLKRFRKEVEAGRVPSLESMLRTRTYDVVNPVPYFVNEYLEVDNIRLVSSGNPNPEDPDFPLSPWFVFDSADDPTLHVFDRAIVQQYDLFALLIQGWYEKPRMKTLTKALQQRYGSEE